MPYFPILWILTNRSFDSWLPCLSVLRVTWILHLMFHGLCFGSPVPGMWAYVLSLFGLLVALSVGFGCCVASWLLPVWGDLVAG